MTPHFAEYQPLPMAPSTPRTNNLGEIDSTHDFEARRQMLYGDGGTKRNLQERHLTMIALAGMIGTGLFLSSGKALAQAGPLGCVLGYLTMGTVTAAIAYCSAEMSAFKPIGGGFVRHATLWLDKSSGVSTGWNFWYSMAVTMAAEISAATTLIGFWAPNLNLCIPITIFWVVIIAVNLSPVRFYGEFEFYFAFIKICLIVGFILAGIILDLGGVPGQERLGFRYWKSPYPLFNEYISTGPGGRFLAFWSTMISAAFAYGNVQVVAIAGAETRDPRRSIPAALKGTFFRVVFFYVVSIFVVSMVVPANDERLSLSTGTAAQSPFVIAFSRANIKALPSIINAVILTSAFSSGNSCTFLASRTLHGLALDGNAPKIFLRLNRFRIPYVAVGASAIWGAITYMSVDKGAFQAFIWLVSLVTTAGIISWVIICLTYLRFFYALRKQDISRDRLPYKSPLQPYLTYYALIMNVLILVFSGWTSFVGHFDVSMFLSNYLNCFIFPAMYLGCKLYFRDKSTPLEDIDFQTELDAIEEEEIDRIYVVPKTTIYDSVLNRLF
ncbi:amino acid permease [Crucibulum laeve]|uniref:Amino acid permease n=1 Tax=Crucibulum laeve TaxID=68775 RepID=A0A5C3MIM9_9AGAR|nr:amino acid permease [Crucibulum laeve]